MRKNCSLMIQGTASSSGKSLLTTALCRILRADGYQVAPFKAQNMSNNSYVTADGLEMGRAQVVQAYAAGLQPDVRMNPVLLKPTSDKKSQVVLRGKPAFTMDASSWHSTRETLRDTIRSCYHSLQKEFDIMVIEGAGSPAEINLKKGDVVNMGMARMADAPVIIVGDIDRGGVFASLVGTLQLLDEDERKRVKGFIINKFRGDVTLLQSGFEQLEAITDVAVLGVVPMIDHAIDDEDGVSQRLAKQSTAMQEIDICAIRLPHISNYTDVIPLERVPGVTLRWCDSAAAIAKPDIIILPGTKATIADLTAIQKTGIAARIQEFAHNGGLVFGICGGFQMLGNDIYDPSHVESSQTKARGLALLDMTTEFDTEKHTTQITLEIHSADSSPLRLLHGQCGPGYEIHMGRSTYGPLSVPFTYSSDTNNTRWQSGITNATGTIAGTYAHGFFDAAAIATNFVNSLRTHKGLAPLEDQLVERMNSLTADIDALAAVVRKSVDIDKIYKIAGLRA